MEIDKQLTDLTIKAYIEAQPSKWKNIVAARHALLDLKNIVRNLWMFLDDLLLEAKDCQGAALQGITSTQDPL